MPVKLRVPKDRRPSFAPAALALFAELDRVPARRRHGQDFKDKGHELARLLGLVDEYWTINSVLDRSTEPHHPAWCVAYRDWHHCRTVRRELLQAVKPSNWKGFSS